MKSYAFIDIIGIKSAIENGSAAEMLQQFWVTVDRKFPQISTDSVNSSVKSAILIQNRRFSPKIM